MGAKKRVAKKAAKASKKKAVDTKQIVPTDSDAIASLAALCMAGQTVEIAFVDDPDPCGAGVGYTINSKGDCPSPVGVFVCIDPTESLVVALVRAADRALESIKDTQRALVAPLTSRSMGTETGTCGHVDDEDLEDD